MKQHTNGRNARPERALARREYVEATPGPAEPSLADVAAKHGYSVKGLQAVAAKENWTGLRQEHRRRLEAARQRALIVEAAEEVAEFDTQAIRVAKAAQGRIARFLVEEGAPSLDANGRLVPDRGLKPSDLQDIASALRTLQQVVHAAAGTPDERPDLGDPAGRAITWADVMAYAKDVQAPIIEHIRPRAGRGGGSTSLRHRRWRPADLARANASAVSALSGATRPSAPSP